MFYDSGIAGSFMMANFTVITNGQGQIQNVQALQNHIQNGINNAFQNTGYGSGQNLLSNLLPSNLDLTIPSNTLFGIGAYVSSLEHYAKANSRYVFTYGTKAMSANRLTAANRLFQYRLSNVANIGGKVIGGAGLLISGYQFADGQITGYELTADAVMTAVGIWGGPWGAAASIVYFGGKALYNYYNPENPLFPKPN